MSEPNEQSKQHDQHGQKADPGAQHFDPELAEELLRLRKQMESAVRTAMSSPRAREIEHDMRAAMQGMGKNMEAAFKSLYDDPRVQEFAERGQDVVNQFQEGQGVREFQRAMARGVFHFNEQIASFIERMERESASQSSHSAQTEPAGSPGSGQEQKHREHPATGETINLETDDRHDDTQNNT